MNHFGRVLPNRKHIVLCNDMKLDVNDENVKVIDSIEELKEYEESEEENFVIGGATIYKLLMPKANKLYVTKINQEFEGDVYFPEIKADEWKIIEREKGLKDDKNPYDYEYVTYVRK